MRSARTPDSTIALERMPSMFYTKVLDVSIAGAPSSKRNWSSIFKEILGLAAKRNGDFEYLRELAKPISMVKDRKTDKGYTYLPELGVSLQGANPNSTVRAIISASKSLELALDIGFEWREKDGAEYPGQRGRIRTS